jgi:uncharacterized protein (DUF1330 family)
MPVYAIFIRERTRIPGELEVYADMAEESLAGHPVKVLAAYGPQQVLEGAALEGAVILEFPTFEAAKEWYESPAYREARVHRWKGADYRAFLVEGI